MAKRKNNGQPMRSVVERAIKVQRIYQQHKEEGVTDLYIYRKYIKPVFYISHRTFQRYLDRNAQRQQKQLNQCQSAN